MSRRLAAAIAGLTLLASAGGTALVLTSDHNDSKLATLMLAVPIGIAFVVTGLIAWARRPENRTGFLMVVTGLLWYIGALGESNSSFLWTLGALLSPLPYVLVLHLVLAYPSGRLETRWARGLALAAYGAALFDAVGLLFDDRRRFCEECPDNALLIEHVDWLANAWELVLVACVLGVIGATITLQVRRWRRATPALRRILSPVYLSGGVALVTLASAFVTSAVSDELAGLFWTFIFLALLAVPVSFLAGLLRSRLARVAAARLLLETPDEPSIEEAQAGLRRVLRDPTLRLGYWDATQETYIDADGKPFELPRQGAHRVATPVEYEGRPLAMLVHDPMLLDEPELLEEVVATTRVALEKDRTLRALRATERRSRALLDAIPDNMFRITREGAYLDASIKDERYLPVPSGELPGTTIRDVLPPDVASVIQDAVTRALDTGEVQTVEYRMQRPVGLRDSEARIVAAGPDEAVIIVRDITERKRADDELRRLYGELEARAAELQRERDLVATVVDTAPAFFCGVDPEGRVVRFNRALEELSGRKDDEAARGLAFWDLFVVPEEQEEFRRCFRHATAGSGGVECESRWVTADGGAAVVAWSAAWYPGEDGADRYLISGSDVTERHRHSAELERQRNFLNAIANNAPSLLCLIDEDGRVQDRATNIAFEKVLEYDPAETGGHVFWERYVHPDDAEDVRLRIARIVAGETLSDHDNRWMTRTGRTLVVAWSCTALPRIDERRLFLISGVDVTERKRQEAEIHASRARIVEAGDAERRRLERNLHDGAQQRLVSLSLSLRRAQAKIRSNPEGSERILDEASAELAVALEELRELARGIHPAVLTDRGLGPALESLVSRAPVRVDVEALPDERLPGPVEAAAFYVVSEALANVAKYSRATAASVRIQRRDGLALVEVADDGVGGADPARGTGLRGLADRVEALDGRLDVESAPGHGTVVRAEIPVAG